MTQEGGRTVPADTRRVAIVTGGGRGIGRAIALRLAADGHAVAVIDLTEESAAGTADQIAAAGGRSLAVAINVADEDGVTAGVEHIAATLGPPTILVNNAGITRDNLLFRMSVQDWMSVLDVHLKGAFLLSRAVQSHMVDARWGRIVSLSSLSALGNRGQANYAAAKAGIQGFTRTLALELGQFGVTANAIAPGFIETDMTAQTAERLKMSFEDFRKAAAAEIAVRRVGQPSDVAALTSFLVSEEAGFISGQTVYATGGPAT
jgi:3-oxoacyl-[acyl-carrier protein] reductase